MPLYYNITNMQKPKASIEITSDSIKLLIGYEEDKKAVCVFTKEVPISGLVRNGNVVDENGLTEVLKTLHSPIIDEKKRLSVTVNEVGFVLPNMYFRALSKSESINTIDTNNEVSRQDITNVITLVKKSTLPPEFDNFQIIDIVPESFILDGGRRFPDPPLKQNSSSLRLDAFIHVLPSDIYTNYINAIQNAGFRTTKVAASAYCNSIYFSSLDNVPSNYLLLDIGAKLTSLSLIGQGKPYQSLCIHFGGDYLIAAVSAQTGLDYQVAEKLIHDYGYDLRKRVFSRPIYSDSNSGISLAQKDLNGILLKEFNDRANLFQDAYKTLEKLGDISGLPVLMTGGGSRLFGIEILLKSILSGKSFYPINPSAIGARNPSYSSLLGMTLLQSRYLGSLQDNFVNCANITREEPPVKRTRKETRGSKDDEIL